MKLRFIPLILIFVFLFCGCGISSDARTAESLAPEVSVTVPEESSESISENSSAQTDSDTSSGAGLYYANTKSKKFHKDTCTAAQKISNENLYITENREELTSAGYEPCKRCLP